MLGGTYLIHNFLILHMVETGSIQLANRHLTNTSFETRRQAYKNPDWLGSPTSRHIRIMCLGELWWCSPLLWIERWNKGEGQNEVYNRKFLNVDWSPQVWTLRADEALGWQQHRQLFHHRTSSKNWNKAFAERSVPFGCSLVWLCIWSAPTWHPKR